MPRAGRRARDSAFTRFGVTAVVLTAIAYAISGRLGQFVAIPPGNVTAVWPPSGIALAAVLLRGPRIWPGIWLGSFAVNLWAFLDHSATRALDLSIVTGAAMAVGATAQGVIGGWPLRGMIDLARPLRRVEDVFRLAAVGGVLSCLVAASVGTLSLCESGIVRWEDFGATWWTWWLGDTTGVLVVAPTLLAWARPAPGRWGQRAAGAAIVLASTAAVWSTARGLGPFASGALSPSAGLLLLQAFVGGLALTAFVVAALAAEAGRQPQPGDGPAHPARLGRDLALVAATGSVLSLLLYFAAERLAGSHALPGTLDWQPWAGLGAGLVVTALVAGHVVSSRRQTAEVQRALRALEAAQAQLVQSEKMASLGQTVAGVAHEINNPITFIGGAAQNLSTRVRDLDALLVRLMGDEEAASDVGKDVRGRIAALEQGVSTILVGTDRVKKIVEGLRTFSRLDEAETKAIDLHEGIDQTLAILGHELGAIEVVRDYGEIPAVECQASQMNQVFLNLIVNAAHAIAAAEHGPRTITIRTRHAGPDVIVSVTDTGCGIAPSALAKIFDPFFTTKPVGQGTGLGLAISFGIIRSHGGRIEVESAVGSGSTFRVVLPLRGFGRAS